jgi:hypothetical protein
VLSGTNKSFSFRDIEIIPIDQARARNNETLGREIAVASGFENVEVLDPLPYVCGPVDCRQWRDQALLYSDLDHLTLGYATKVLAPEVMRQTGQGR